MNIITIVACLVLGCIAISEAQNNYGGRPLLIRPTKPIKEIGYCRDYRGKRVAPGASYFDGCNTCRCGVNGMRGYSLDGQDGDYMSRQPSICTRRACGPFNGGGPRPIRPVARVW